MQLRVTDNGKGIGPALLPHVFDLFVQGEAGIDREQGGLGLGLTLVRRLVEMHGGSVEARSEGEGRGSEFIVRLPLMHEPQPGPAAPEDVAGGANGHARILLVDDSRDTIATLEALLRFEGYDVASAHDGESGLALAMSFQPRVVLLDIGLPGMDGCQVARALRALPPEKRPAVLIGLSGYGQPADRQRAMDAGFDH